LRHQDSNLDLTAPKAVVLPLHHGGSAARGPLVLSCYDETGGTEVAHWIQPRSTASATKWSSRDAIAAASQLCHAPVSSSATPWRAASAIADAVSAIPGNVSVPKSASTGSVTPSNVSSNPTRSTCDSAMPSGIQLSTTS